MKLSTDSVWTNSGPSSFGKRTILKQKTNWLCVCGSATHFAHLFNSEMISYYKMQDDTSCAWAWIVLQTWACHPLKSRRVTHPPHLKEGWDTHHSNFIAMWWAWHLVMCTSATSKQCPAIRVWQQHCLHPCSRNCVDSFLPEKESRLSWRCLWKHSGVHICRKKT